LCLGGAWAVDFIGGGGCLLVASGAGGV